MKSIDKQKFQKTMDEAQVSIKLSYCGNDGNVVLYVDWNGKSMSPEQLTDEQAMLLFQVSGKMCSELAKEPIKRDLVPGYIAKLFTDKKEKKNS